MPEQAPDARLMVSNQFAKGVVIILDKNTCNEVCIGKRHAAMLGQRRSFVSRRFQFPNQQISKANDEGYSPEAPRPAFPVVNGPEENHAPETNHQQDDATAKIGSGSYHGRC